MLEMIGGMPRPLWKLVLDGIRTHREKGEKILLLVPEQYTLDTERRLIRDLKLPGFFDIDVLSPKRLNSRVFQRSGSPRRTLIDRCGRQMALSRVLSEVKEGLLFYKSAAEGQGFIEKTGVQISQLKQSGVTPEALLEQAEKSEDKAAKDKYRDIATILEAYSQLLEGQFMDGEDETQAMLERLNDSKLCENAAVFVYGFDMITEQLAHILCALSENAEQVTLYVVMNRESCFEPVRKSLKHLMKQAAERHLETLLHYSEQDDTQAEKELLFLESQMLRTRPAAFPSVPENIFLFSVPNGYTEMHLIASKMLQMNRRGIAFGDMVLALGDSGSADMVRSVMGEYRIPVYVAHKMAAVNHGASRFLLSSLRFLDSLMPWDALDMIKSGFCPLEEEEGWQMENYICTYGIRGSLFLKPFRRGKESEYVPAEQMRQKLLAPLLALKPLFDEKKEIRDLLTGVYTYLEQCGVYDRLVFLQDQLSKEHPDLAVQCGQVWEVLMQLLSQMDSLLTGLTCTPLNMAVWLEAGLRSRELSSLPPAADCVACGDIGNLPLSDKKVVFASGLCDTLLSPASPALLEDSETIWLEQQLDVHLTLSGPEQDQMRWLDLWKTFSAPSETLFLTYPLARQDGTALRPVSCLTRLRALFPLLRDQGGATLAQGAVFPLAPLPVLASAPIRMRSGKLPEDWQQSWNWLCQSPEYGPSAARIRNLILPEKTEALPASLTRELFMGGSLSISRLETFASCPFRHFVRFGLQPKEEKEWTLEKRDTGDFYHDALEGFTAMLPQIKGWPHIKKAECDAAMEKAIDPLLTRLYTETAMGDSSQLQYSGEKYKKTLKRIAWAFTKGARNSSFRPRDQEISFGTGEEGSLPALPLRLPDGSLCYLRGRIDRVDRYEGDEGLFLRVIDYKSSGKEMDPTRIWYGAQLQLLLYLGAVLESEPSAQPAGCFYFRMDDPLVEQPKDIQALEDLLAEQFRLKGVALKDAAILRLMDSGSAPRTLPDCINKDGSFKKTAQLATLEEMRALIAKARENAGALAARMLKGEIAPDPFTVKNSPSPCSMCDYASICRREPGKEPRAVESIRFDQLIAKVLAADEPQTEA